MLIPTNCSETKTASTTPDTTEQDIEGTGTVDGSRMAAGTDY